MKKIIIFSKDLSIGGMEKSLIVLLNELVNYYKVTLVLENITGELLSDLNKNILIKKYPISNSKIVFIRKIINGFNRLCWKIKYNNKYDFSCNYATYLVWASRLAQISSKNSAYYVHSNYYEVFNHDQKKFKDFFDQHNIGKFKNIIFVSNESLNSFINVYPNVNKVMVINNLIDYKNIRKLAGVNKNDLFDNEKVNLLFIGRLDNDSKNIDLLLDSFCLAYKDNNNINLTIIGDGDYKDNINEFIKKNNLNNCIKSLGALTNPYPYLKAADALILTSNYEGNPVVYSEALVLDKVILTTILTSDNEIDIKNYSVYLKKDKRDIANKIAKLSKKDIHYNLDFDIINEKRISHLKSIIEE